MHDRETIEKALEWLNTSITIRQPKSKQKFCDSIGISVPTLNKWEAEYGNGKLKRFDRMIDELADLTDEDIQRFKRRVHERAMEKGASAKHMELNAKLLGILVEKSEHSVRVSNDADTLARIDAEAERRASDFREQNRAKDVQEESNLLPEKIREDT